MINKKVLSVKFLLTLCCLFMFAVVMVYADRFATGENKIVVSSVFVAQDESSSSDITMDYVSIDTDENTNGGTLQYVVQPGDSLGKIAGLFGTTVSNLKKVNKISDTIKPGQKLVISNDDQGFLYTIPENINVVVFANKYSLNKDEFMTLNYIQDESEMLYKGQDVFVNCTDEQAYDNGLKQRPKPKAPKVERPSYAKNFKEEINKVQKFARQSSDESDDDSNEPAIPAKKSTVISQWVFKKNIKNSFYPGYCTWYAAIISPEIFPYSEENKQEREFGGNASQWCDNAKKAGFSVGTKPAAGALIVYRRSLGRLTSAGHVGKVMNYYPEDGKMIIRDMNRVGKFIVTERREETDNGNIRCYIYPGK